MSLAGSNETRTKIKIIRPVCANSNEFSIVVMRPLGASKNNETRWMRKKNDWT